MSRWPARLSRVPHDELVNLLELVVACHAHECQVRKSAASNLAALYHGIRQLSHDEAIELATLICEGPTGEARALMQASAARYDQAPPGVLESTDLLPGLMQWLELEHSRSGAVAHVCTSWASAWSTRKRLDAERAGTEQPLSKAARHSALSDRLRTQHVS